MMSLTTLPGIGDTHYAFDNYMSTGGTHSGRGLCVCVLLVLKPRTGNEKLHH